MNLALRIRFSIFLALLLAGVYTHAQTETRRPAATKQTSIAPTNSSKPRVMTAPPKAVEKAKQGNSTANDRSTSANSASRPSTGANNTGLRPSPTTLRNTGYGRPPSPSYNQSKTASKSVARPLKKVQPLKNSEKVAVQWLTLEQALEKSKTEKRKIFIDVYTDWCGWCKHMDSTTFVTPAVANYLNKNYYAVKMNAEQTQDIVFKDKTYHFKKVGTRGYHELAALWLNNRLSYPTVVFLDESQNLIQPVPGYQDATKMEAIINYFGSDNHRKTPWETYEKNFSGQK